MTRVAILQSNYIPWKGYFDLIASVDTFVLYDDMQYTKRDWRNRNKIKTPNGLKWLSIPVQVKGKYYQSINETQVSDNSWVESHLSSISQNYKKAKFYSDVMEWLQPLYQQVNTLSLSAINKHFISSLCDQLDINTNIVDSQDFKLVEGKTERLVDICKQLQATEYVSGPAAKGYIDSALFSGQNIQLSWADYSGYPEYNQLWGGFEHSVTILDLLFNVGSDATKYMKYLK